MDMRPQDLGSVENGSPQRLLGLRQVTRFAVARDAFEGDSGPIHLNHVPLGVVEVERGRPGWLMDRLIGTPLSMTRW